VIEDINQLLSRHIGKSEVSQVTDLVAKLFDAHAPKKAACDTTTEANATVVPLHPRNRHLH
jgi:hypothetical protein